MRAPLSPSSERRAHSLSLSLPLRWPTQSNLARDKMCAAYHIYCNKLNLPSTASTSTTKLIITTQITYLLWLITSNPRSHWTLLAAFSYSPNHTGDIFTLRPKVVVDVVIVVIVFVPLQRANEYLHIHSHTSTQTTQARIRSLANSFISITSSFSSIKLNTHTYYAQELYPFVYSARTPTHKQMPYLEQV